MVRAGLTADRVVEAAADLADEVGFENVTLSALARRFGVKDASLYSHIKNLQDLRTRVALLAAGEMIDGIATAVAGRAGKDALVAFAATHTPIDPAAGAASDAFRRTAEITYGMLHAYGLAEPDLTDAVRLLRSTFHGFCALEAIGGFHATRDVQTSWERALDGLHTALEHWPRSERKEEDHA
jgi:AcrR family transcriptional regulator